MDNLARLQSYLAPMAEGGFCVAFSGGVDSSVVLAAACKASKNVHAVTFYSPLHSPLEKTQAEEIANSFSAKHTVLFKDLPDELLHNPTDRCYICKKMLFSSLLEYAAEHNLATVLDGNNADDLESARPGMRAVRELSVVSPLKALGFTKKDVRDLARQMGLDAAEKPSNPCLATRLEYGMRLDATLLANIDRLETLIRGFNIAVVRVRLCRDILRIEVLPQDFSVIISHRNSIIDLAKQLGFKQITLDMQGFRSGSMDE